MCSLPKGGRGAEQGLPSGSRAWLDHGSAGTINFCIVKVDDKFLNYNEIASKLNTILLRFSHQRLSLPPPIFGINIINCIWVRMNLNDLYNKLIEFKWPLFPCSYFAI